MAGSRRPIGTENSLRNDLQVCERLSRDRTIRAAVWTCAGKAFCAGGDIKAMLARTLDPQLEPVDDG